MTVADLDKFVLDPSCRLWLPLAHMDGRAGGANIRSRDAYGLKLTVAGAYWTPLGWYFDGTDDQLQGLADDTGHLDFTGEDFTAIVRLRFRTQAGTQSLVSRFQWNASGWGFWVNAAAVVQVFTIQAGANQNSSGGSANALTDGEVYTVGFSRSGASVLIYFNGAWKPGGAVGSHIDPVTCARHMGVGSSGYNSDNLNGNIKAVAVWARALSPHEHARFHDLFKEAFP